MRKAALAAALFFALLAARDADATSVGAFVAFFDTGSAKFTKETTEVLDDFVAAWNAEGKGLVEIYGNADRSGSSQRNHRLSCARAAATKAYFVDHGIPWNDIRIIGWGEKRLLIETADGVANSQNRRVEIYLLPRNVGFLNFKMDVQPCPN
jgi:outer membrane protein OmpA-like peptidoglycan-associated protein